VVDQHFRFHFDSVWQAELAFRKEGYQDSELRFNTFPGVDPHHDMDRVKGEAADITQPDLRVILRRKEAP
jgi:hypothetical protein